MKKWGAGHAKSPGGNDASARTAGIAGKDNGTGLVGGCFGKFLRDDAVTVIRKKSAGHNSHGLGRCHGWRMSLSGSDRGDDTAGDGIFRRVWW
jgi:hypothetical protein